MAETSSVSLRDPVDEDAAVYASFPTDPEIALMFGVLASEVPEPNLSFTQGWLKWFREQPYAQMIERDGIPVGHLRLHTLSERDRSARLAIGLFAPEFLGQGTGRRAIALALDHAFGPMGLHRVDLRVLGYNERAIRCYRACGFTHEGTMRHSARIDGEWHDDWIMGILAHEHPAKS